MTGLDDLLQKPVLIYLTDGRRLTGKLLSTDPLTIRGPGGLTEEIRLGQVSSISLAAPTKPEKVRTPPTPRNCAACGTRLHRLPTYCPLCVRLKQVQR